MNVTVQNCLAIDMNDELTVYLFLCCVFFCFWWHSILEGPAGNTSDPIDDQRNHQWQPLAFQSVGHDCTKSLDIVDSDCGTRHVSLVVGGTFVYDACQTSSECRSETV